MKKSFSFFAVLLLLAGCGNVKNQENKNLDVANFLSEQFECDSVIVSTSEAYGIKYIIIKATTSDVGYRLSFESQRVACAMAISACKSMGVSDHDVQMKIGGSWSMQGHVFHQKDLSSYRTSVDAAENYLVAMLKGDRAQLLKLGDATYLGESNIQQVLGLADKAKAYEKECSRVLAGILDTNIDNTQIPIHAISFAYTDKIGNTHQCTFFVHSEGDHKIAGLDIR